MDDNKVPAEKKTVAKARSCNHEQQAKVKNEPCKRKSLNFNGSIKSLDLALCRLKKSKLVPKDCVGRFANQDAVENLSNGLDMFIDSGNMMTCSSNFARKFENTSAMSINFSQYELTRNVSCIDCRSESTFSNNTCNNSSSPADLTLKHEQLEKYFRSAEKWNHKINKNPPNNVRVNLPEK